jgi:hypothetical protein
MRLSLSKTLTLREQAQGKPGVRCTRGRACSGSKHARCHHEFTGNIRLSPRNGFTTYFVLSPVTGLFCHRRLVNTFTKLDASVEVSGPHDFAVRVSAIRQKRIRVHRIPHPASTSVTTAKRRSGEAGWRGFTNVLIGLRIELFLREGLDNPNQFESAE